MKRSRINWFVVFITSEIDKQAKVRMEKINVSNMALVDFLTEKFNIEKIGVVILILDKLS